MRTQQSTGRGSGELAVIVLNGLAKHRVCDPDGRSPLRDCRPALRRWPHGHWYAADGDFGGEVVKIIEPSQWYPREGGKLYRVASRIVPASLLRFVPLSTKFGSSVQILEMVGANTVSREKL